MPSRHQYVATHEGAAQPSLRAVAGASTWPHTKGRRSPLKSEPITAVPKRCDAPVRGRLRKAWRKSNCSRKIQGRVCSTHSFEKAHNLLYTETSIHGASRRLQRPSLLSPFSAHSASHGAAVAPAGPHPSLRISVAPADAAAVRLRPEAPQPAGLASRCRPALRAFRARNFAWHSGPAIGIALHATGRFCPSLAWPGPARKRHTGDKLSRSSREPPRRRPRRR